ncbi:MAG: UvrD-helicase domain-containing protein, partial [Pseudomonadales bacterium]
MDGLNKPQREAVKYIDSPLLVLAGAGSGKTSVITRKVAYLIEHCGISARNI